MFDLKFEGKISFQSFFSLVRYEFDTHNTHKWTNT